MNRIRAQTCADCSFFYHFQRSRQRTGTQQQSQIIGCFSGKVTGNDTAAAGNWTLNIWRRNNLIIQNNSQSFTNVTAGHFAEFAAANSVETETYNRHTVRKRNTSVSQIFTADNRFFNHNILLAFRTVHHAGSFADFTTFSLSNTGCFINQMERHFSGFT